MLLCSGMLLLPVEQVKAVCMVSSHHALLLVMQAGDDISMTVSDLAGVSPKQIGLDASAGWHRGGS